MKKCIISLNLLYYITFFHRFNGAESRSASSSTGQSTPETAAVDSGSTNPPVTDTVTTITLDINKSKDTNEFYYKKDGNFRTYTPKASNVFTKVVKKSLEIWKSKPDDNALKVVLMGSGNKPKHLALLLQSSYFVLLHKSGKNKPWINITSTRHDVTKLKFLGDNDVELSKSDYKVDLVDLSFTFAFNSGVNCKKVTFNNTPLWSHTDDPKFSSLKSLSLDLAKDKFSITNSSDETKELTKAKVSVDVNATQTGGTQPTPTPPSCTPSGGTPQTPTTGATPSTPPTTTPSTPPTTTPGTTPTASPTGTHLSGSGGGTQQTRSGRPTNGTPQSGTGTRTGTGTGTTPHTGTGSGTGTQQTGTNEGNEQRTQSYSGSSDYERLLDENLKTMTTQQTQ